MNYSPSDPSVGAALLCSITLGVFVILKLTGLIAWSWWVVLLPILAPVGMVWGMVILVGVMDIVVDLTDIRRRER